jgi:pimeloyl-ACP methyl ester carboxylesterase
MADITTEMVTTRLGDIEVRRGGSSPDIGPHAGDDGDTIVYLHSASGEGDGLVFLRLLADCYPVIAPMFPGFGASEGIEAIDDIEDAAFHLLDLWDVLGLDHPTVVGLSLGGWLALELATRWPERVGRLVVVNPAGLYLPGAEINDIFGRTPGEMAGDLFYRQDHPMAQMMHAMDGRRANASVTSEIPFEFIRPIAQTMAATARIAWDPYLHNPKLRGRLYRIDAPTLVVRGEHDGLVPAPHAETFAHEIPAARLAVVADTAHLVPLEEPRKLADLIVDFVGST